jgi:hypothetical protein
MDRSVRLSAYMLRISGYSAHEHVCTCACMCVRVCVCTHTCMHASIHTYAYICVCASMHVESNLGPCFGFVASHMCIYMHVCALVQTHIRTCTCEMLLQFRCFNSVYTCAHCTCMYIYIAAGLLGFLLYNPDAYAHAFMHTLQLLTKFSCIHTRIAYLHVHLIR